MFRVIIAGSREFQDYAILKATMDKLLKNVRDEIVIISGTARGADALGERYARERNYAIHSFPAEWDRFGKAAGFVRNEEMAANADALVAFWDGQSRGTKHMIDIAKRNQLKVRIIRF